MRSAEPHTSPCYLYVWSYYFNTLYCVNQKGNASSLVQFNKTNSGYILRMASDANRLNFYNGSLYSVVRVSKVDRDEGNSTINFVQYSPGSGHVTVSPPLGHLPGTLISYLAPYNSWIDPSGALYTSVVTKTYPLMLAKWLNINAAPIAWAYSQIHQSCEQIAQTIDFVNSLAYTLLYCDAPTAYLLYTNRPSSYVPFLPIHTSMIDHHAQSCNIHHSWEGIHSDDVQ